MGILSPIGDLKYPIGDWGYMSLVAQSQRTISNPKLDKIKSIGDFIPNWVFYSVIPLVQCCLLFWYLGLFCMQKNVNRDFKCVRKFTFIKFLPTFLLSTYLPTYHYSVQRRQEERLFYQGLREKEKKRSAFYNSIRKTIPGHFFISLIV